MNRMYSFVSFVLALTVLSNNAMALTTPVSEPGTLSLIGLGAVVTILAVRHFRR